MWYDHYSNTLHPITHKRTGHYSDAAWMRSVVRLKSFAEAISAAFWDRFPQTISPMISSREKKNKEKMNKWFPIPGFYWALFVASPPSIRKHFKRSGSVFAVSLEGLNSMCF
jgi:hypothetical protein